MDDMISRQAAIDALIKRDANCGIDSAEVIRQLPSVQPDIARDIATILENEKDMRVILNAPSVQPQKNDETCDSCRYRYNEWDEDPCDGCTPADSGYCPDSIELQPPISKREWYQIGYEAGQKSVQPQRWIPCSERLPEPNVNVLWSCHYPGESEFFPEHWYVKISVFDGVTNHGKPSVYDIGEAVEVLAWMPLPEPWRGGQDD